MSDRNLGDSKCFNLIQCIYSNIKHTYIYIYTRTRAHTHARANTANFLSQTEIGSIDENQDSRQDCAHCKENSLRIIGTMVRNRDHSQLYLTIYLFV